MYRKTMEIVRTAYIIHSSFSYISTYQLWHNLKFVTFDMITGGNFTYLTLRTRISCLNYFVKYSRRVFLICTAIPATANNFQQLLVKRVLFKQNVGLELVT